MFKFIASKTKLQQRYYKEVVSNLEKGMCVKYKGKYCSVTKILHQKIAMRGALFNVEFQDLETGKKSAENIKPTQEYEVIETDSYDVEYLRKEEDTLYFKRKDSDEDDEKEIEVDVQMIPNYIFLTPGTQCRILMRIDEEEELLNIRIPDFLPGVVKSIQNGKLVLENGAVVKGAPMHIEIGEEISVRLDDMSYHSSKKSERKK